MSDDTTIPAWGSLAVTGWRKCWLRFLHDLPGNYAWRRLALWLRKPLKKTLAPIVDLEVWGLRLRLRTQGNLSEQRMIFMPQFLDIYERQTLARELADGGVFFDVGTNVGAYTLWAATIHPEVDIHSFEPDEELCQRLTFNLQTNNLQNVHLNRCAVGDRDGEVTLIRGAKNRGENRVSDQEHDDGLTVPLTSLSNYVRANGITAITALKIDIEGMEVIALTPLFNETPPSVWPRVIICELPGRGERTDLNQLLAENGYRLRQRGRMNGIFYRD